MSKKRFCTEMLYNGNKTDGNGANIDDLPVEVFYEGIFCNLADIDVLNFGKTGNRRFEMIAEDYLRCKYTL